MALIRFIRQLRSSVDAFDVLFGFFPWMTWYMVFVTQAGQIVRAIRGEAVKDDWRSTLAMALHIAARAIASATEVRESVALRESVATTGQLLRDAAKDEEARDKRMRELLREAAADAEARDKRAAEREDKLYKVAALTLLAAIVTLIVTIITSL